VAAGAPAAPSPARPGELTRRRNAWLARLDAPLAPYYLILGSTIALVMIGLVMVLSSSSVQSLKDTHLSSSYSYFVKQVMFAGLGLPLAWVASRIPARWWQTCSWALLAGSAGMLALVPVMGSSVNGNQNWISFGGVTVQPSEAAKFAFLVWAATVLVRKQQLRLTTLSHLLVPVLPVAALLLALVLAGRDLGTAMIMMAIVFGVLYLAGAPMRLFGLTGAGALLLVGALVVTSPNRMGRISSWLGVGGHDDSGLNWQPLHGAYALATGGWWGLGLGASREKWFWLPEAHNDFIFAIIGEELGLPGTLAVLGLFGLLGVGLLRLVTVSEDVFVKISTGGVLLWVVGQAVVNIGAVLGVLPVVGVPLPLVSSGGSALVMTLIALGMVLGFARHVPGAGEALTDRPGMMRRSLAVLPRRAEAVATRHRATGRGGAR
jgi:cell division protein FtsW